MQPADFSPLHPKTILAIGAHADDIDFGAAGSIAKWAAMGATVDYLVLTDGRKGTSNRSVNPSDLARLRQEEQRRAAATVGVRNVHFVDYEDGRLEITADLKKQIVRHIRTIRPDTIITLDPAILYVSALGIINHPDHRAAGQATLDAVYPYARDHLSFPELLHDGLGPHIVEHLLLINLERQNYYEDITDHMATKLRALECHASQYNGHIRSMVMRCATTCGAHAGCGYAEGYMRIDVA